MSANVVVQSSTSVPKSRNRRTVLLLIMVAAALIGAPIVWVSSIARSPLPQLDGSVAVSGLSAPVRVTRDRHGVPTIEAASLRDLFFAQGYVTAQDRLFQMDLMRRSAAGELAEVFGEITLQHDRQQRILGIRATSEKVLIALTPQDRQQFEDYASGVNAFIESHRGSLPLEFRLLHYAPRPWTPQDSLVIAAQMVETLSRSPQAALTREKILARLGPELTADLYVNNSWRDRPPAEPGPSMDETPEHNKTSSPPALTSIVPHSHRASPPESEESAWLTPFFRDEAVPVGSNNWVVSGAHTTTGKPLLSNDMHLGHQMPNLWYEVHLRSGDFDVAGVSLPGHPYVIVGHNRRIAWGCTNLGPTVEDAYIETFNDSGQYLTPEGWKQPEKRQEVIHAKGKPDVMLDVLVTRHGPIVTELAKGETRKIALRWTLYEGMRDPFFRIDSAKNWQEFHRALSEFDVPGQNVVYADVDGNIGYQAAGKIPIRAAGDGSLPVNGSDNAHEWSGYIPFDKLPSVLNPASGIIATANSRVTPAQYPYPISVEWEAPWRTARIYRVLQSGKKFSAVDMLSLQTDIYSELDRFVADKVVYAVDHEASASASARKAADILREWNGQMDGNSAASTIVTQTRAELKRMLLEPKLASSPNPSDLGWQSYSWKMETIWLENVLSHQPARWLPPGFSNYDALLTAALEQALKKAPEKLESWKWGPQNLVFIQNPILDQIPALRFWTGPGLKPQSGSATTAKAVRRDHGPSERFTADLSNFDVSTLNVVTGESGNFLSPYYMDQWDAWYNGYTFPLPFSKTAVEDAATHLLMLEPK